MEYTKRPLTLKEQIEKLKKRGLIVADEDLAMKYLSNISYYRLRAYTYPFQDNENPEADHKFLRDDIGFKDIIDIYCFDRRLRLLMFNAIEKIEVAVRCKLALAYAISTGNSHWFTDKLLFMNTQKLNKDGSVTKSYEKLIGDINNEIKRSNEDFIKHYFDKYTEPSSPPAWMTFEVMSFGTLSKLYHDLKKSETKRNIAREFGLKNERILENWLHAISVWRNSCAHHGRVWNRRSIVNLMLPKHPVYPFIDKDDIGKLHPNKVFTVLSCIKYLINIISPGSDLKNNILSIIKEGGKLLNINEMGFPKNWENLDVWK